MLVAPSIGQRFLRPFRDARIKCTATQLVCARKLLQSQTKWFMQMIILLTCPDSAASQDLAEAKLGGLVALLLKLGAEELV